MKAALHSIAVATLLCSSCNQDPPLPPPPSAEEETRVRNVGNQVADELVKTLGAELKAALQSGGPVAAVSVCQSAAQPLTSSVTASMPGVGVRRTALRVRNPVNTPDDTDRTVLEEFSAAPPGQIPPDIIKWTETTTRFYKPLITQEVCIQCHGNPDSFSPELQSLLNTSYPHDQATGFSTGDLRGVIRVDLQRP